MSRDWLLYLDDLIEGAEKIQRFLKGKAFEGFASDELLFDAVLFNLAKQIRKRFDVDNDSTVTRE